MYPVNRGKLSGEGRVYYRGPLPAPSNIPKIKLDLTTDEVVVLPPERRRVQHGYSDEPADGIHVLCYPYAEVFAEKTRALLERDRPRDLYDVINLFRRDDARQSAANVREVLAEKCRYKGIDLPTLASVGAHKAELEADWEPMLGHQLPALPPFESYWDELPAFFRWLEDRVEPATRAAFPLATGDQLVQAPLGRLGSVGLAGTPLETIRFAAANRLCVDLDYIDDNGKRSTRTIEPYSLRRTSTGEVVLHAERADGNGHRAYRVDRIRGAGVSSRTFEPRFAVELIPTSSYGVREAPRRASPASSLGIRATRRRASSTITYRYVCPLCGRTFTRQRPDARLRPHKNKSGRPCAGRVGRRV